MESILNRIERDFTKHKEAIVGIIATQEMLDTTSNGLVKVDLNYDHSIVAARKLLEATRQFRQFISYTLVVNKEGKILLYYRKKGGNEKGLHDLFSIGIGGHLDAEDLQLNQDGGFDIEASLNKFISRELHEELKFDGKSNHELISINRLAGYYLITNDNPVDSVHLGVISVALVDTNNLKSGEEDIIDVRGFFFPEELHDFNLENWSKLLIESETVKQLIKQLTNKG